MKKWLLRNCLALAVVGSIGSQAAVITVTTTNNVSPPAGQTSLFQALSSVNSGDTIRFNIPGDGPHYIATPVGGYPLITKDNVTIDGYSQPGSSPNTNPILATNNAKIKIVLDSRNANSRLLDFAPSGPDDSTGYGDSESAILGVLEAKGADIRGLALISVPLAGQNANGDDIKVYGVSFAKGASGHVSGCWIGVDLDGVSIFGPADGVTGFRYQDKVNSENILVNDVVLGVSKTSTNAPAEFNVIVGIPGIPIIIEGSGTRISGNFVGVLPDGLHDVDLAFDPNLAGFFEGHIEIGRAGDNTLIGTDGDGANDSNERNVFGGVVPPDMGGYEHAIEFYGQTPGTNIVVAGNYIGVGVDGFTRFTNGVPVFNAAGDNAQFRFGSDFDGVSDDVEANVCFNNWPTDLFPTTGSTGFFDELKPAAILSGRGNIMVNNNPFPVSPEATSGGDTFYNVYYAKALNDVNNGVVPVLSTNTSLTRLIGKVPVANSDFPVTIVDLYAVDPEGVAYGQTAGLPSMPNGYVQGRAYIASFVEGSAADLNPNPGEFEFDISKVELKGSMLTVTANYSKSTNGTHNAITLTSPFAEPVEVTYTPGSVESVGLRHIVPDTVVINQQMDSLGNWEPYASVLGNSTFLIEGNAFADGTADSQRYVVAFQPAAGGAMKLGEAVFADNGTPFKGIVNASRQNGNPGRVAGDKRPGASNFITGVEASPHVYPEFQSDNRWTLGFDRLSDGRYGIVETYKLDPSTLTQTALSKAQDSANGRVTSGDPQGNNQITRFGGDVAGLDNGNFVSVVEDRSKLRNPDGDAVVATIFAPNGSVVKDSFKVANGDIWANVAAYKGGFAVRVNGIIYFYDDAGNLTGQVDQGTSGASFDKGRGDGTRLGGHINSPYVYLIGKVTDGAFVRMAVWDARTQQFVAITDVSEGAFTGGFDRANMDVDALNRVAATWVSQPAGYEQQQVAARVIAFNEATKSFKALTTSFLPFINTATNGGIRTLQMSVAMTTKQILIAAKGEINLQNNPANGVNSPREINFYTVISHPDPKDDPTTPAGSGNGGQGTLSISRSGSNIMLTWTGAATLQSAPAVSGPWTNVSTTGTTYTTTPAGASMFFRLRTP